MTLKTWVVAALMMTMTTAVQANSQVTTSSGLPSQIPQMAANESLQTPLESPLNEQALNTVYKADAAKNRARLPRKDAQDHSANRVIETTKQHLISTLRQAGINAPINSIESTELPSLYRVNIAAMNLPPFYMTAEGNYLIEAELHPTTTYLGSDLIVEPDTMAVKGLPVSEEVRASIIKNLSGMPDDVQLYYTAVPGLIWGIHLNSSQFLTTTNGSLISEGEILVIKNGQFMGLDTDFETQKNRYILSKLDPEQLIVYPATTQERATIHVVTDVNCPSCRILHQHIPQINAQGITVKLIGFPYYSEESREQMRQIWCENDKKARKKAFHVAMNGILQKGRSICQPNENPLYDNQILASGLGTLGSPLIYRSDGVLYDQPFELETLLTFLDLASI